MKTLITLVLTILFSTLCVAQNGINYKAIIKDNLGNVVANDPVIVQFAILQGVAQTNVYQEYHTPTTDANGLIIINIGEGTPLLGTFSAINWASDTNFLNTQIDTGTGMVDMGTTEFKTVPYALQAKNVASKEFISENGVTHTTTITDDFVVGSQTLDFAVGGQENDNTHRMFFDKSKGAFRAGSAGAWFQGGLFNNPNAWDDANVGYGSFASGADNTASGDFSNAMGSYNIASGDYSTAMGFNSVATGVSSFAIGNNVFEENTFTIASGSRSVAFGNGTEASGVNSIAFGKDTEAIGVNSTAMGYSSEASGIYSTAIGFNTTAMASYTTAFGLGTIASGYGSTSMGHTTVANGYASTSMGQNTTASGAYSTSMGYYTTASSYASLVIGKNNVGGGASNSWVETDPLFEVGFGTSSANKLNSLTVLKNGKVGIGTATPSSRFQITNGSDASYSSTSGYLVLGSTTGSNLVFDDNEIIARNNGLASPLFLQQDGGDVRVGGVVVHSSDFRLKKDIAPLTYGLETILELNPVEYNWKNREQEFKTLGLIAQEVQPVIENIVHTADDEDQTLSVSYTELIPFLINAVKELKAENDALRSRVETLENNKKDL
jgi:hypothetical protein